jgi:hypothetical protein
MLKYRTTAAEALLYYDDVLCGGGFLIAQSSPFI